MKLKKRGIDFRSKDNAEREKFYEKYRFKTDLRVSSEPDETRTSDKNPMGDKIQSSDKSPRKGESCEEK